MKTKNNDSGAVRLTLLVSIASVLWINLAMAWSAQTGTQNPTTDVRLQIMPMGDSITEGTVTGGYRRPLYHLLQRGGCRFDFVGAKTVPGDTTPAPNHWGCSGWQISDIPMTIGGRSYVSIQGQNRLGLYSQMSDAISLTYFSTDPNVRNIILLMIGANDHLHQAVDSAHGSFDSDAGHDGQGEGQDWIAEGCIARLQALLAEMNTRAANLGLRIDVIVATLPKITKDWTGDTVSDGIINEILQYNQWIRTSLPAAGFSNLTLKAVDMEGPLAGKLADGLHPDAAGYDAMAVAWYEAITGGQVKAEPGKAVPSDSAADYQAVPTNPAMRPVQDIAGLPRVLLIGDSISIGYTVSVQERLAGKANVHRIAENGGPTTNGLAKIDAWLGAGRWDVIHFNWGLHDLKIMDNGQQQVSLPDYQRNLDQLVNRLRQTGAKLIWASTTPVPQGKLKTPRRPEDVPVYNELARKVMEKHGVSINDLYAFALPRLSEIQIPDNVHFTPAGSAVLAQTVAQAILTSLNNVEAGCMIKPDSSDWLGTKQQSCCGPEIPRLAWGSIPEQFTSIQRFKELKEAGITHHFHYHYSDADQAQKALDAAQAAGIKMILTCPQLQTDPEGTVKRFQNHPALEAYFIKDEPKNEQGFIAAGVLADRIRAVDKSHFCYLNLLPGGKTNSVGTIPYADYLGWYSKYFKPEIVSFDHYPIYTDKVSDKIRVRPDWYDNLECISEFSRNIGKPFWAFALSVSHDIASKRYPEPAIEHLRLQVYSNLAYGAQGIQYFTYWTPKTDSENPVNNDEYYYKGPILPDGQKTPIYDLVKTVNQEISNLSFVFYGSTVKWVRHIGIGSQNTTVALTNELNSTPIRELNGQGGILVSLHKKCDKHYLVVVNYELKENLLEIQTASPVFRILKSGASKEAEKQLRLLPGDAAIYTWNPSAP